MIATNVSYNRLPYDFISQVYIFLTKYTSRRHTSFCALYWRVLMWKLLAFSQLLCFSKEQFRIKEKGGWRVHSLHPRLSWQQRWRLRHAGHSHGHGHLVWHGFRSPVVGGQTLNHDLLFSRVLYCLLRSGHVLSGNQKRQRRREQPEHATSTFLFSVAARGISRDSGGPKAKSLSMEPLTPIIYTSTKGICSSEPFNF